MARYCKCNIVFLWVSVFITFIVCLHLLESTNSALKLAFRKKKTTTVPQDDYICDGKDPHCQTEIISIIQCNEFHVFSRAAFNIHTSNMRESSVKSPSVIGLVLELLISCVFAWQTAVQSKGADMCEWSDALPSALCVSACMDRLNAMLPVVDFTCVKWLKQNPKYGFTFNAALLRIVMRKWIWCFWRKAKMKWLIICSVLSPDWSVCPMDVILAESYVKLKWPFTWPAIGLIDHHTAIVQYVTLSFQTCPLKVPNPTPKWMAIGLFSCVL